MTSSNARMWALLIELAERRLSRIELKRVQLRALIAIMREKSAAGEPTPMELCETVMKLLPESDVASQGDKP